MFRKGGSAGEGITSGLSAPRQGYEGGKTVEELNAKNMDLSKIDIRNMNLNDWCFNSRDRIR